MAKAEWGPGWAVGLRAGSWRALGPLPCKDQIFFLGEGGSPGRVLNRGGTGSEKRGHGEQTVVAVESEEALDRLWEQRGGHTSGAGDARTLLATRASRRRALQLQAWPQPPCPSPEPSFFGPHSQWQ